MTHAPRPSDTPPGIEVGEPPVTGARLTAEQIRYFVFQELQNRTGFSGWWDGIDDDIQNEIKMTLIDIIHRKILQNFQTPEAPQHAPERPQRS